MLASRRLAVALLVVPLTLGPAACGADAPELPHLDEVSGPLRSAADDLTAQVDAARNRISGVGLNEIRDTEIAIDSAYQAAEDARQALREDATTTDAQQALEDARRRLAEASDQLRKAAVPADDATRATLEQLQASMDGLAEQVALATR